MALNRLTPSHFIELLVFVWLSTSIVIQKTGNLTVNKLLHFRITQYIPYSLPLVIISGDSVIHVKFMNTCIWHYLIMYNCLYTI